MSVNIYKNKQLVPIAGTKMPSDTKIPEKTSDLENDNKFVSENEMNAYVALHSENTLQPYVKDTDYAGYGKTGVVKLHMDNGILVDNNNALKLNIPTPSQLKDKANIFATLIPSNIDSIVKYGLTDNQLDWTDEEKKSALDLLGAVMNPKPLANSLLAVNGDNVTPLQYANKYPYENQFCTMAGANDGKEIRGTGYGLTNDPINPYHTANKKYVDDRVFIAESDYTSYKELDTAYKEGKMCYCRFAKFILPLIKRPTSDKDSYCFSISDESGNGLIIDVYSDNSWIKKNQIFVTSTTISRIEDMVVNLDNKYKSQIDKMDESVELNTKNISSLLTSSFNSFRGGFRDTEGVLKINAPGIYMVMQAGTGNKNIVITQDGEEVLNEKWNGVFVLSSDTGIITPVGIKTGLTQWATPGTYQGWIKNRNTHTTTISYPAGAVVWYMGNSNVDIGK